MAQAPRGQSRSAQQKPDDRNAWPSILPDAAFFESRLTPLRGAPRLSSTVSIGGRTYGAVDNGRANVLFPADDLFVSPAELAERRRAVSRTAAIAANPVGGAAYGLAALMNASQPTRDRALAMGAVVDAMILGAAPRGASRRGPAATHRGQMAPPSWEQDNIRPRESNARGQALGVNATLTPSMLGAGTKANRRLRPPGWLGHGGKHNQARGHLVAKGLGGSGRDPLNIVTLTHRGANTPQMSDFERNVARRVGAGEVIDYSVIPLYGSAAAPSAVLMTAYGPRNGFTGRVVENPAGRDR